MSVRSARPPGASSPQKLSRSASVIDKLQAEVAAAEAYRRALDMEASSNQPSRTASNRSQKRNNGEGSHLAEARLGRRKSVASARAGKSITIDRMTKSSPGTLRAADHASVVLAHSSHVQGRGNLPRRTSVTAQGSPTPRRKPVPASARPFTPAISHGQQFSHEEETGVEIQFVDRSVVTSEDSIELHNRREVGPEKHWNQSSPIQQSSLSSRASRFFGPVQKLRKRSSTLPERQAFKRDISVPPYNFAGQDAILPPPVSESSAQAVEPVAQVVPHVSKAKSISLAVKSRLKSLMRKPSRASGLPPQHIPAKQLHYMDLDSDQNTSLNGLSGQSTTVFGSGDHSTSVSARSVTTATVCGSADIDGQSRVTSWTNSSLTQATRCQSAIGSGVDENGMLYRSGSVQRLKNRASFFGRQVNNKLRKASRADLNASQESQGLYNALQTLIQASGRKADVVGDGAVAIVDSSPLGGIVDVPLPQRACRQDSETPRAAYGRVPSVWSVSLTPEHFRAHEKTMSPVVEVCSPTTTRPSPEQIARRVAQAQNRWMDAVESGCSRNAYVDENPYELSAIEKQMVAEPASINGVGSHSAHVERRALRGTLSPSIYSRATDETLQVDTPEQARTSITITGREVRSFKIPPVKPDQEPAVEQSVRVSSEWRRWMSSELREFSAGSADAAVFTNTSQSDARPSSVHTEQLVREDLHEGISSGYDGKAEPASRPRHDSGSSEGTRPASRTYLRSSAMRRSSFMNERYPMVDTSRPSSRQSRSASRVSGLVVSSSSGAQKMKEPNTDSYRSVGDLVSELRSRSSMNAHDMRILQDQHTGAASRPKSSFELRAQFKSSLSEEARPLDIHRKSVGRISPDDETLRRISAGPYAADHQHRENTPPVKALPALSSSAWLAGTTGSRIEGMSGRLLSSSPNGGSKSVSPGHRMTTGWLKERNSASGGRAFL